MYRIGYIDDEPTQFENYARKIKRRCKDLELVLLSGCKTKSEFLEKIYEEQIDVLLIDYRMTTTFGFNGTTLVNYINDHVRDLECFIFTAVDKEHITDGLVAERNRFPKTVFDTEAGDSKKVEEFNNFIKALIESAINCYIAVDHIPAVTPCGRTAVHHSVVSTFLGFPVLPIFITGSVRNRWRW